MAIEPMVVERDADGFWEHSEVPWDTFPEEVSLVPSFKDLGFKCHGSLMQDELSNEAMDAFDAQGDYNCSFWEPKKPEGSEWFLVSIHDTEEGPCALWIAPLS